MINNQKMIGSPHSKQAGRDIFEINIHENTSTYKFYEKDISSVINELDSYISINTDSDKGISNNRFQLIPKPEKNRINNLSEEYFEYLCLEHLSDFQKIDTFLKDPMNNQYLNKYLNIVRMIRHELVTIRTRYLYFEEALKYITDSMLNSFKEENFSSEKIFMVITFVNYMYWNCEIGRKEEK